MCIKNLPLRLGWRVALSCLLAWGLSLQAAEIEAVLHGALSAPESRAVAMPQPPAYPPPCPLFGKAPGHPPPASFPGAADLLDILFHSAGCPSWKGRLLEERGQRFQQSDRATREREMQLLSRLAEKLFGRFLSPSPWPILRKAYQLHCPDLPVPAHAEAFREQMRGDPGLPGRLLETLLEDKHGYYLLLRLVACLKEKLAEEGSPIPPSLDCIDMLGDIYEQALEASDRKIPHPLLTGFIRRAYKEADMAVPEGLFSGEMVQLLRKFCPDPLYHTIDLTWLHKAVDDQRPLDLFMTDFLLRIGSPGYMGMLPLREEACEHRRPWGTRQGWAEKADPIDRPLSVLGRARLGYGEHIVFYSPPLAIREDRWRLFFCYYVCHLCGHLSTAISLLRAIIEQNDPRRSITGALSGFFFLTLLDGSMKCVKIWGADRYFSELFTEIGYPPLLCCQDSRTRPGVPALLRAEELLCSLSVLLYYVSVIVGKYG